MNIEEILRILEYTLYKLNDIYPLTFHIEYIIEEFKDNLLKKTKKGVNMNLNTLKNKLKNFYIKSSNFIKPYLKGYKKIHKYIIFNVNFEVWYFNNYTLKPYLKPKMEKFKKFIHEKMGDLRVFRKKMNPKLKRLCHKLKGFYIKSVLFLLHCANKVLVPMITAVNEKYFEFAFKQRRWNLGH